MKRKIKKNSRKLRVQNYETINPNPNAARYCRERGKWTKKNRKRNSNVENNPTQK